MSNGRVRAASGLAEQSVRTNVTRRLKPATRLCLEPFTIRVCGPDVRRSAKVGEVELPHEQSALVTTLTGKDQLWPAVLVGGVQTFDDQPAYLHLGFGIESVKHRHVDGVRLSQARGEIPREDISAHDDATRLDPFDRNGAMSVTPGRDHYSVRERIR